MKQLKYYGAMHLKFMECCNIYKYYAALPPKTDFINGVHTNTCRTIILTLSIAKGSTILLNIHLDVIFNLLQLLKFN